ncbi:MAG: hypothetical protein AMXMBFR7_18960 [Planctomycetota bacterium]
MVRRLDQIPAVVADRLRAFDRRKRMYALLRAGCAAFVVFALWALLAAHGDRLLFLDLGERILLQRAGLGLAALVFLAGAVRAILRRFDPRATAYEMESKLPESVQERFVTLADLDLPLETNAAAQEMRADLERSAVEAGQGIRAGSLVRDRALTRWALAAFLVLAGLGGLCLAPGYEFPLMAERFLFPERNLPKPSFVKLKIAPSAELVGRGGEWVAQVEVSGALPRPLAWLLQQLGRRPERCEIGLLEYASEASDFDAAERHELTRVQRQLFLFQRSELQEGFAYRIRYGDAETSLERVEVVAQPRIEVLSVVAEPPAYSGLPPVPVDDARRPMRFLAGTKVTLRFSTDQPVTQRLLLIEGQAEPTQPEWDDAARTGTHTFTLTKKVALEVRAVNARGFANVDRARVTIEMAEDQAPGVNLEYPAGEVEAVAAEWVPLRAALTDDLGLREAALRYVVNPGAAADEVPREIPLPLDPSGAKNAALSAHLDLGQTGAIPGDVVAVRIRARDSAGSDGESREFLIKVVPFTRGEDERQRLLALKVLAETLDAVAATPAADGAKSDDRFALPKDAAALLSQRASAEGLAWSGVSDLHGLLVQLEVEHHLTESHLAKEDLARLYLLLAWYAGAEGDRPELRALAARTIPGLLRYRSARNALLRLWGMRTEARNLAVKMAEEDAQSSLPAERKEALKRHAGLYAKALGDIGAEVQAFAAQIEGFDAAGLLDSLGELNVAARFMSTGSAARRKQSAAQVVQSIEELCARLQPVLGPSHTHWAETREACVGQMLAVAKAVAKAADDPDDVRHEEAMAWLAARARLFDRMPFAGLGEWVRAEGSLLRAAKQEAAEFESAYAADSEMGRRLAQEHRGGVWLSFEAAIESALSNRRLAADERAFELDLLRLERAISLGLCDAGAEQAAWAALGRQPLELPDSTGALREGLAAAKHAAQRARAELPSPILALRDSRKRSQTILTEMKGWLEALKAEGKDRESGAWLERFQAWLAAADRERGRLRAAQRFVQAGIGLGAWKPEEELTALGLLEMHERMESRMHRVTSGLRELPAGTLGARELSGMTLLYQQAQEIQSAWIAFLDKWQAALEAGELEGASYREKYAGLAGRETSRAYLDAARNWSDAAQAGERAALFLREHPDAARVCLASALGSAQELTRALQAVSEALAGAAPDGAAYAAARSQAAEAGTVVRRAGALVNSLEALAAPAAKIEALAVAIERMPATVQAAEPEALSRRKYDLAALLKDAAALEASLREMNTSTVEAQGLSGGPEGLSKPEWRKQAERARSRLVTLEALAKRGVALGASRLANRSPDADPAGAQAWAGWWVGLLRSGLSGAGGQRTGGGGESASSDPHRRFLREELEKARKVRSLKHYAAPTYEYLDSMSDFLRH